jgi:hypothetical protein
MLAAREAKAACWRVAGAKAGASVAAGATFLAAAFVDALRLLEGGSLPRVRHTRRPSSEEPRGPDCGHWVLGRAGEAGRTAARVACSESA